MINRKNTPLDPAPDLRWLPFSLARLAEFLTDAERHFATGSSIKMEPDAIFGARLAVAGAIGIANHLTREFPEAA